MPSAPTFLSPSSARSGIRASRSISSGSTCSARNSRRLEEPLPVVNRLRGQLRLGMDQIELEIAHEQLAPEARLLPIRLARSFSELLNLVANGEEIEVTAAAQPSP